MRRLLGIGFAFVTATACEPAPPPNVATTPAPTASAVPTTPPVSSAPATTKGTRRHVNGRCAERKPCTAGEICVESHTGATSVECVTADPCAGAPLSCACAGSLCNGLSCVGASPAGITCDSGSLAP